LGDSAEAGDGTERRRLMLCDDAPERLRMDAESIDPLSGSLECIADKVCVRQLSRCTQAYWIRRLNYALSPIRTTLTSISRPSRQIRRVTLSPTR